MVTTELVFGAVLQGLVGQAGDAALEGAKAS
jgi:hypothetical protein